jgi:glycosyltransferase involved in cell wall biosynthesis
MMATIPQMNNSKIAIFTKYSRLGASSRLRTMQYIPHLIDNGFEVTVFSLFSNVYLENLYSGKKANKLYFLKRFFKRFIELFSLYKYEVVWIEKELFPYSPPFFEKMLSILGIKYVIDYDDAIFHNYDLSQNSIIRYFLSNKIDKVMKYSACVTAGNSYLAERAVKSCAKKVKIIPTVVEHNKYKIVGSNHGKITIGWVGTPSTQKYIVELQAVLTEVCLKFNAKLMLVGAEPSIAKFFENIELDVVPWTEEAESNLISGIDVGVMPLHDGLWEKGKCGYKLIQYMAAGKPVLASNVGVNKEIINKCNSGYSINNENEWRKYLSLIVNDRELREQLGENGRVSVVKYYSLESQLPKLTEIFNDLIAIK